MSQTYPTLQMDRALELAIARVALTLLERNVCGCNNLENMQAHWREDLTMQESNSTGNSSYQINDDVLRNPLGTTRGALYAWRILNDDGRRIGRAVRF